MKKVFLLAMLSILFTSCSKDSPLYLGKSDYYYEVTGTASRFSVTIEGAPKGTSQYSDVISGWKYTWTQSGERFLYVSAQNQTGSGTVTVKIYKNGKVLTQQTSSGAYVIASTSGTY